MNRVFLLIMMFLSISLTAYEQQTDSIPAIDSTPTFNYHKDFKRLVDSAQNNESGLYYHKLLKRFLDNDSTLTRYQTLALMIGFTEDSHYKPLEDMEKEQEIFEHNKNGEFKTAIEKSRVFLPNHPLSLLVLREISYAYQQISKEYANNFIMDTAIICQDSGKYFMDLNDKIMEAMIFSGKGKKPEDPIFSLGLADGEYFIPNVGYRIESDGVKESKDTEWNRDGDFVEVITAMVDNVTAKKFYFVIQHAKQKIDDDAADAQTAKNAKKSKKKDVKKDVKKTTPEKKNKKPSKEEKNKVENTNDPAPAPAAVSDSNQTSRPVVDTIPAALKP